MQYNQHEFNEVVGRLRANSQAARIPPPPSTTPPRFTAPLASSKHYVLSEVELATFRTQLCESHQRNRCTRPDACPHSHCLTWQRRNPYEIIYDPHLCPGIEFRRSNSKMSLIRHCTRGRSCAYAHSKEEELYHPLMYKTKPCTVYPKCDRHYCPFAHSTEEVRQPFNNPLIHYIWGSASVVECQVPDTVQRWAVSPLPSFQRPPLVEETAHLPPLCSQSLEERAPQLQQPQLQLLQQQERTRQQQMPRDSQQTAHERSSEQLFGVPPSAAAAVPPYSFTAPQQRQQRQKFVVCDSKQTGRQPASEQALSSYTTKQSGDIPVAAGASQRPPLSIQRQSHLRQSAEILQSLKVAEEEGAAGKETAERTGKGKRLAGGEHSLLSQPLSTEKILPLSITDELQAALLEGGTESQRHTLPAASDTTSSTTTTVSTDLQDLLDSESIRRALIMALAQQLIGPQVNQLSVDQVILVLDLAVKLAPHLTLSTSSPAFFGPVPAGELLQLHESEPGSPQQSSLTPGNTATHASSAAACEDVRLKGSSSGSSDTLQQDFMRQQPLHQCSNGAPAAALPRDARSATTYVARPGTTGDDVFGETTSSSLLDTQLQDADPVASLAATQVLIEQLRKLSLLNSYEEGSHNCSSPAPSLEEAETSSLSIVRGSSTTVWSTSTSPIIGGGSDLSSRYANLSSRHTDLVATTAITAAATTFASASSSADEASVCACPSLTIAQDLATCAEKQQQHATSPAAVAGGAFAEGKRAGGASSIPRKTRGTVCASPASDTFREHTAKRAQRSASGGGNTGTATVCDVKKLTPRFSSASGGGDCPQSRGLLPPPGNGGAGLRVLDASDKLLSASYALPLLEHGHSRCSSDGAAAAVASSPPPPPPPMHSQHGSCGRSHFSPDALGRKQQQGIGLQKRGLLTGTLAATRKLGEPFSPQLTTCSHSPSVGHFSSPQRPVGRGLSAELASAYNSRLPGQGQSSDASNKNCCGHVIRANCQGRSRGAVHEGQTAVLDEGPYSQRIKATGPHAST